MGVSNAVSSFFKGASSAIGGILGLSPEAPEVPEAPEPPPSPTDEEVAEKRQQAAYEELKKKRGRAANILSPSTGGGLQDDNPTLAGKSLLG